MHPYLQEANRVIDIETQALQLLKTQLNEQFTGAVNALKKTVEQGKKIVVVGVGKSGNIGHKIAATLNSTGAPAVVLNAQNAFHGDLGIIADGDLIIALSFSGNTEELIKLLPHLSLKDTKLIGITGNSDSTLAKEADFCLLTPIEIEACPLGVAPTSSSTAALVMGDALAMVLLKARGFSKDDFAKYHPKGALGETLLTRIKDIMRTEEQLALLPKEANVMEAVRKMSKARSGACFIIDAEGLLLGIFTHGDFARAYQENAEVGKEPLEKYMNKKPVTLSPEALAAEALKMVRKYEIDDVPVINTKNKVIGVIDSQDLASLNLI